MALIKCEKCGKEISDKAKACPQCGHPLTSRTADPDQALPVICEECGAQIPKHADACPNCGCPVAAAETPSESAPQKVEVTGVSLPKVQKKRMIMIAAAAAAVLAVVLIGNGVRQQQLQARTQQLAEEYAANMEAASQTMLLGAIDAENTGNLIKSVWYNSIYEERDSETDKYTRPNGYFVSDFNDALANLFADSDFQDTIASIEPNQQLVSDLMKDLRNPPEEFEDAYEALGELYDAYTALTNLTTNPSGSLTTFSQDFNDADSEMANRYDTMSLYLND